jgi:hypothetical protein
MVRVIYASSRARHFAIGTPKVMGLTRFELVTPRLSSVCSNQLSYRPPTSRLRRFVAASPAACPAVARSAEADSLKTR